MAESRITAWLDSALSSLEERRKRSASVYKVVDVLFKYSNWLLAVSAFTYLSRETHSHVLGFLSYILIWAMTLPVYDYIHHEEIPIKLTRRYFCRFVILLVLSSALAGIIQAEIYKITDAIMKAQHHHE